MPRNGRQKIWIFLLFNLLVVLLVFGGIELYFSWLLHHPDRCSQKQYGIIKQYYHDHLVDIVQLNPEFAHYDSTLFYRLKPGKAIQQELEFEAEYHINSKGFRDDEASLDYPEIVFLGDSYTMGWGIPQDSTFVQRVEASTGLKCLNAGISSYGTAREMASLDSIKTDSLKLLVIQYCSNDHIENDNYYKQGNKLKVSTKEVYDSQVESRKKIIRYYPFKYTIQLLPRFFNLERKEKKNTNAGEPVVRALNHTDAFMNVLYQERNRVKNIPILIFNLDVNGTSQSEVENAEKMVTEYPENEFYQQLNFTQIEDQYAPENLFLLDGHINKSGHEEVAKTLLREIIQILKVHHTSPLKK